MWPRRQSDSRRADQRSRVPESNAGRSGQVSGREAGTGHQAVQPHHSSAARGGEAFSQVLKCHRVAASESLCYEFVVY